MLLLGDIGNTDTKICLINDKLKIIKKVIISSKKFKREVLGNIPLGKFAELSDVASAATFLASDAASMITGTSLLVDGGWTAK